MICDAYRIPAESSTIIRNVFPPPTINNIENSRTILWAGRMIYLKNLYHLISVFAEVNDGSWELHLVGDGPERKRLEEFIKKENIRGVRLLPPMSKENILKKMRESAFFVLPSLSDVGPDVIADAVATRLPFIMTKESGSVEYLKDIGFFINPLDEEELKERMMRLMNEDERRKAKERMEHVLLKRSWEEATEEWLTLFSSVQDKQ